MTEPMEKKQRVTSASEASGSPVSAAPAAAGKPGVKSKYCLNCQKDLTRNIRITCVDCPSNSSAAPASVELCVECFSVGVEPGGHKKTHRYTVSDCLAFPLVRERLSAASASVASATAPAAAATTATPAVAKEADWTAEEELLLLEAIEMFGMGNWKDIAEHVATKSDRKCENHYMTAYLGTADLMPRFLDQPLSAADEVKELQQLKDKAQIQQAHAAATAAAVGETTAAAAMPSGGSELSGYMPLRGDFDVEYDNEAELILADMEFADDDHPTERELKLKVIEIYNSKLDERERRKKFVVERGLLDYKKHQQTERRRPKEERELIAQMRPFARFQTPKEHDDFVTGLITAMRLRKQILLLQEYRKNGVRTLAEAELYDVEKKKRDTEQALQKQRDSAAYLYESGRPVSGGRDRANRWWHRDQSATNDAQDHPRTRGSLVGTGASAGSADAASASAFSIDGTPGSHLLTPKEKELCCKLKLLPKVRGGWLIVQVCLSLTMCVWQHYLVIKDALVRECYRLGYLTKKTAKEIVKIGTWLWVWQSSCWHSD